MLAAKAYRVDVVVLGLLGFGPACAKLHSSSERFVFSFVCSVPKMSSYHGASLVHCGTGSPAQATGSPHFALVLSTPWKVRH